MDRTERFEQVMADLRLHGRVGVPELARRFRVSELTVRRDLEELERQGVAQRIHGGAVSAVSRSFEPPFALRQVRATDDKQRIAAVAAATLSEGQTVLLDIGTTTLEVARALRGRRNLTVITPGLRHAGELADDVGLRVIVLGGIVRTGEHSLIGPSTREALERFHIDVCVLGAGGIGAEAGLTEFDLDDAAIKRAAIERAGRTVLVADASKLGAVAFAVVAPATAVDLLVTSAPDDHPEVRRLRELGVDVRTT